MIISYIAHIRLPTEKAHGLQIMKSCEALTNAGHSVTLIASNRATPIAEDPFEYYAVPPIFSVRKSFVPDFMYVGRIGYVLQSLVFAVSALLSVRTERPDIVYTRDEAVAALAVLLGMENVAWESHDGAWNVLARIAARGARRLVVVTRGAAEFYVSRGVSTDKIAVIPNGVDIAAFASMPLPSDSRREFGIPPERKVAMYVGAFDGWKGTDTLLEASRLLSPENLIVAVGASVDSIPSLKKKYPSVLFLPPTPVRTLPRLLAAADVCVLPNTAKDPISVRFTCPLKLLAYMAAGKPVIASDLPSIRELAEGVAYFVPPDDAQALADGIRSLLQDDGKCSRLAASARERARRYDWKVRANHISSYLFPVPRESQ
jgi:glycosyltransferase involved in cell wall biosynthesis